jgi:hypothetical protein
VSEGCVNLHGPLTPLEFMTPCGSSKVRSCSDGPELPDQSCCACRLCVQSWALMICQKYSSGLTCRSLLARLQSHRCVCACHTSSSCTIVIFWQCLCNHITAVAAQSARTAASASSYATRVPTVIPAQRGSQATLQTVAHNVPHTPWLTNPTAHRGSNERPAHVAHI